MSDIGTHQIEYGRTPTGGVTATVTVTLPGGHVERATAVIEEDEVAGIFGDIGKALKAVGGKAMGIASKGLSLASNFLPPQYAIPAKAASMALGVGAKLTAARVAPKAQAKKIVAAAKRDAQRLTKSPGGAASLLRAANAKSTNALKLAVARKSATSAVKRRSAVSAPTGDALLSAARAGRVRSNRAGSISREALLAAHRSGRVFWVA